ncbi:5'/3'-nucleotidase SurE [Roseburia sp. 499]|uniref:5'/3'-nucleotidase SurE n=1 Tax=Roseburia sp. 499 TaxID=1261634 RepID=UPI00178C9692|nr:5'/3'-nucleotidase SurE [Roseburia sp. 499]WVK71643.1 hypothetical protein BIV20_12040 [Roseburia sp. 499]
MMTELKQRESVGSRNSVSGTPADCVKVALMQLLPERPDVMKWYTYFFTLVCEFQNFADLRLRILIWKTGL